MFTNESSRHKLLSEGAISLMLVHGDRSYTATAAEAAKTLLRSHASHARPVEGELTAHPHGVTSPRSSAT
jgi:hypothetical protein